MAWTSPATWVAGAVLTAAQLNTQLRDNMKAVGDAWASYTPTLGGFTLGNGTIVARSMQAGKLTHFSIEFTFGSTSTAAGNPTFTLPVTARNTNSLDSHPLTGAAFVLDVSASGRTYYTPVMNTAGTVVFARNEAGAAVSSTTITWATGDKFVIVGSYEAA